MTTFPPCASVLKQAGLTFNRSSVITLRRVVLTVTSSEETWKSYCLCERVSPQLNFSALLKDVIYLREYYLSWSRALDYNVRKVLLLRVCVLTSDVSL